MIKTELTNDETTEAYDKAKEFLNKIKIDSISNKEELIKLWNAARFIDIRCRVDGREYFFEGEGLRWYFNELIDKSK